MRDLVSYIAETVDSVVNRQSRNEEVDNAMRDLNEFIQNQRPQIPDRPELPGAPQFKRQHVTERTDEEICELATDKLADQRLAGERGIETDMQNRERDLNTQRENAQTSAESQKQAAAESFERAQNAVNNDALRRGLARSSIAVNRQADLAEQNAAQTAAIGTTLARNLEQMDNDLAALEGQRAQALADFNVTQAARLTQTIHTLQAEQDRARRDAIAFNNNVAEQERRAEIERQERGAALHQRELDILERERNLGGGAAAVQNAVFNKMVETLNRLAPTDARRQVMENPIFRDNLTPQEFYRLYDRFTRGR